MVWKKNKRYMLHHFYYDYLKISSSVKYHFYCTEKKTSWAWFKMDEDVPFYGSALICNTYRN